MSMRKPRMRNQKNNAISDYLIDTLEIRIKSKSFYDYRVCENCGKLTDKETKAKMINFGTGKIRYFCTLDCKGEYIENHRIGVDFDD